MASNSEANLPSDFDIDEVINWDEHNYSSKVCSVITRNTHKIVLDIGFQLPSLDLPSDVKTSQNMTVNHPSLSSTVVSSQQKTLPVTQNTSQSFHSLFGTPNNSAIIRNSKTSHGFPSCPVLTQSTLRPNFPSQSLNIPPINPSPSSASLLQFSSNPIQNATLTNQIHMQQLQNVQNTRNMSTDSVPPFTDHAIDDSTPFFEGPLDKIVDQLVDQELNKVIMHTSSPPNTFDQHSVATFTNVQSRSSPSAVSGMQCVSGSSNITDSITTIQSSAAQTIQRNAPGHQQSQFVMSSGSVGSNVVRTLAQASTISGLPQNTNIQDKAAVSLQSATNIEELFTIQAPVGSAGPTVEQNQFMNPPAKSSPIPTPSLLSSPVNNPKSTSPIMSTSMSMSGNMKLTTQLNANTLQSQIKTGAINNGLNRTQNNASPKMAFMTSVCNSSQNNITSQAIQSPGSNIQRSITQQGQVGSPLLGHGTTASNIPRTASQAVQDLQMQVFLQHLTGAPGHQPNIIQGLSKQGTNDLPSHLATSQPKSSPNSTRSVFTLVHDPSTKIPLFENTNTSSVGSLSNQPSSNQNLNNQGTANLPSHLVNSQASQPKIAPTKLSFARGNMVAPSTTSSECNDNFSVFSMVNPSNKPVLSQSNQKQPVPRSSYTVAAGVESTSSPTNVTTAPMQPMVTVPTTLKITSPSASILGGFKQPSFANQSPQIASLHTILSQLSPSLSTASLQSVTQASSNMNVFSKYQLAGPQTTSTVFNPLKPSPMVFTLAPGSQESANLKSLAGIGKHKVFLLHQPGKVGLSDSKAQPMKILFVNESTVGQVVSGPHKASAQLPPTPVVRSRSPVQTVVQPTTFTSTAMKTDERPLLSPVPDTSEGSPCSVNSNDSDVVPITIMQQTSTSKKKEAASVAEKKTGKKRKKDVNKPVKPLSTFQRFFQKTQANIRQQVPNAPFPEVSKIAKQMWERLATKDKKVYQDAWRTEREQYKKALEEYNTDLNETEVDGPSPKQLKNGQTSTSPISASPVGSPTSDVVIISVTTTTTTSVPTPSSGATPSSTVVGPPPSSTVVGPPPSSTVVGPPRGSGKPLAMMVELANKTKMASEQASGKTLATVKPSSWSKTKGPSNGIEDGVSQKKKKLKINPIPKKSCIRENCTKISKTTKERGNSFCSNECVMLHCRGMFKMWVDTRHTSFKAA